MKNYEATIKEYLSKATNLPIEELDSDMMLSEFGITSLQFLQYIAEIEEMFNISFSERELNNIYTINEMVELIERKKNEGI